MLPIFWLETADADLAAITDYIGARNINAAESMWHRLRSCVLPLWKSCKTSPFVW